MKQTRLFRKNYLHSIALFMICLIITIPIYVSNVYAAGLSNIKVYGKDGVEGYIKDGDTVTIEADSQVSGDTDVNAAQNRLGGQGVCTAGLPFDSCTDPDKDGKFHCVISLDTSGSTLTHPRTPFDIYLYKDDCSFYDTKKVYGYFDSIAPTLTLKVDPNRANKEIKWITTVRDFDDLNGATCSGISRVEFSLNDPSNIVQTIDWASKSCSNTTVTTRSAYDFPNGDYTLYAKAYDRFNNPSSVVKAYFSIDTIPPDVDESSLNITDAAGKEIHYLARQQVLATVKIKVRATDDLDVSSITADLSAFNPSQDYSNLPATCGREQNGFIECSWIIYIKISKSNAYMFKMSVPDGTGNVNEVNIPYVIEYDIEGPVVNFLQTERVDSSGMSYVRKSGNTFIAGILDYGVGVGASSVFLDATSLGLGIIPASNCTGSMCYWQGVNALGGEGINKVSITDGTKDLLGNKLAQPYPVDVTVDKTLPTITSFSMRLGGGSTTVYEGYIKTGDFLSIQMNISEKSPVSAIADFSGIISGADSVEGTCTDLGKSTYQCSWETPSINKAGAAILKFNVFDFAGNNITYTKDVTVYGTTTGTVDYWDNKVSCSPTLLDREVAMLVKQKVYCRVALTPKEDDPKTISIRLAECKGDNLESSAIMNNQEGSTDPYIKLSFAKKEMKLNTLNVNCTFAIVSLADGKVTTIPEQEPVPISIGLYNMPLGEYTQEVKDKIQSAQDSRDSGFWKAIGAIDKFIQYANMLCTFLGIIDKIRLIWDFISNGLDVARLTPATVPAAVAGCVGSSAAGQAEEHAYWGLNKFCKFLSCRLDFTHTKFWGLGQDGVFGKWEAGGQGLISNINFGADMFGVDPSKYLNPKDSIVLSLLTACIPGIIYNLNKYRQILCMYSDCLESYAKAGLPIKACEEQKSYATCKYVYGEIFALIPWTALFDYFMNLIKQAFSDPLALMGVVLGVLCYYLCAKSGTMHTVCQITKLASLIGELYGDLSNLGATFALKKDYCKDKGIF